MSTATRPESIHVSLIDDLLELRDNPFPKEHEELVAMLEDVNRTGPAWRAHFAAIDTALDLLVPALQRALESAVTEKGHGTCLERDQVRQILGRVPRRVTGRYTRE